MKLIYDDEKHEKITIELRNTDVDKEQLNRAFRTILLFESWDTESIDEIVPRFTGL